MLQGPPVTPLLHPPDPCYKMDPCYKTKSFQMTQNNGLIQIVVNRTTILFWSIPDIPDTAIQSIPSITRCIIGLTPMMSSEKTP